MKTYNQVIKELKALESVFGFDPTKLEQGSEEWKQMKLGVISASNAYKVLKDPSSATYRTYMAELVGQIATREFPEISARPLEWGKNNELAARSIYEFETGLDFKEVPFIFKDSSLRYGCSPDSYGEIGVELKCPYTTKVFINFACHGIIKPEYIDQCQFSMWVTGAHKWHFANYDPRMMVKQFHYVIIDRDPQRMRMFDEAVPQFVWEMDCALHKLGIKFGHQWHVDLPEFPHEESMQMIERPANWKKEEARKQVDMFNPSMVTEEQIKKANAIKAKKMKSVKDVKFKIGQGVD